jgi:hypothetical protein
MDGRLQFPFFLLKGSGALAVFWNVLGKPARPGGPLDAYDFLRHPLGSAHTIERYYEKQSRSDPIVVVPRVMQSILPLGVHWP